MTIDKHNRTWCKTRRHGTQPREAGRNRHLRRFPQTERAGSPADLQPKKPAAFVTAETYHIVALDSGSVFFLQRGLQEA